MGRARTLAAAAAVAAGVLLAVAVMFAVFAPTTRAVGFLAVGVFATALYAAAGVLVARQAPRNVVGPLLALVAVAIAFTVAKEIGWEVVAALEQPKRLGWLVAVLEESAWLAFVALALVLLYFPNGKLPSRRWRPVPIALVASGALTQASGAFEQQPFRSPVEAVPRPFGPAPVWFEALGFAAFLALLALLVVSALSPWARLRRSDGKERQQLRWLALAGLGLPLYPFLCLVEIGIWGRPLWASLLVGILTFVAVPVAVAIAIIRHDVYDVDTLFAGTLTWVILTTALLAVYAGSSFVVGAVVGAESAIVAAAVTAVCAVALQPARKWLQGMIDRTAYPLRRDAFAAVSALHSDTNAGRAQPEDLETVLRAALRDPGLQVGYAAPGTTELLDVSGRPVAIEGGVPVRLEGDTIGVLRPGVHGTSALLLRQVGDRATTLVELVRLRQEMARLLAEVEASRMRLLQAGYDERRRLERDLHDGAQQRLVSLGMSLRVAQRQLRHGVEIDVDAMLDRSVAELGTAVAELRQIAHGLRPSSLDDGLRAAVSGLVRSLPVAVELEICSDLLPDDVATTAYYVLSEAVANALKHADARLIRLQATRESGRLVIRVGDDGRGGARLDPSSGIADRIAALGGELKVSSPLGRGTLLEAELPCAS